MVRKNRNHVAPGNALPHLLRFHFVHTSLVPFQNDPVLTDLLQTPRFRQLVEHQVANEIGVRPACLDWNQATPNPLVRGVRVNAWIRAAEARNITPHVVFVLTKLPIPDLDQLPALQSEPTMTEMVNRVVINTAVHDTTTNDLVAVNEAQATTIHDLVAEKEAKTATNHDLVATKEAQAAAIHALVATKEAQAATIKRLIATNNEQRYTIEELSTDVDKLQNSIAEQEKYIRTIMPLSVNTIKRQVLGWYREQQFNLPEVGRQEGDSTKVLIRRLLEAFPQNELNIWMVKQYSLLSQNIHAHPTKAAARMVLEDDDKRYSEVFNILFP